MHASQFNVRVPLDDCDDVFLMNTFTDAQLVVSRDVAELLDRVARGDRHFDAEERQAVHTLAEHGFIVENREADWRNLEEFFARFRENNDQLRVTVLTTLQCNFACDYCIQETTATTTSTRQRCRWSRRCGWRRGPRNGSMR